MTEFTFITANDIHVSDTAPRSRIDDFKGTILNKISQMRAACGKLGADAALYAGDIYNLKNPARNSHELNQDLIREFNKFPCPRYAIEGNHDLTANNLDSLREQPLGVLFEDKTLIQLRHEVIEKDGYKVSLVGIPYTENLEISKLQVPDKSDCVAQICLVHTYASPTPGMLFKEQIHGYKEFAHLSPDVFVFGHYHIDQGIEEIDGKYYVNIGSISRGTLSDEDISHHPQIGFIRITVDGNDVKINTQAIRLKVKPVDEVFDLKKREEEQKESKEIELFVEKLMTESDGTDIDDTDKDFNEIVRNMDVAQTVKDKVVHFLQEAASKR